MVDHHTSIIDLKMFAIYLAYGLIVIISLFIARVLLNMCCYFDPSNLEETLSEIAAIPLDFIPSPFRRSRHLAIRRHRSQIRTAPQIDMSTSMDAV